MHSCKATKKKVLHSSYNCNAYHQKRKEKEDRQGKSTKQVKQIPIKEKTHRKHLNYQTSFPGFKLIFKSKMQSVRILLTIYNTLAQIKNLHKRKQTHLPINSYSNLLHNEVLFK